MSDIDLHLKFPEPQDWVREFVTTKMRHAWRLRNLRSVSRILNAHKAFIGTEVVGAKNPLVKTRHRRSDIEFQLVVARDDHSGKRLSLTRNYISEYPNLKPLYHMVRLILDSRDLGDPYTGGLGSYATLLLLVAFFRFNSGTGTGDLGQELMKFLDFVAEFNTSRNCISIDPPQIFKKRQPDLVVHSLAFKAALEESEVSRIRRFII